MELIFQRLAVPPILLFISWFSGTWPKSVEERIALQTLHLQLFLPPESWLVKGNTVKENSINLGASPVKHNDEKLHLGVSASTIQWIAIKGTVWQGALTPKVENLFRWTSVTSTVFGVVVKGFLKLTIYLWLLLAKSEFIISLIHFIEKSEIFTTRYKSYIALSKFHLTTTRSR